MEHQVEKLEDEPEENTNYNEMANAVIRRFCSREVGWLEGTSTMPPMKNTS